MAEKDLVIPTDVLPDGVHSRGYKAPVPDRGLGGYAWDQVVGLGQQAIDVLQTPATLARDATTTQYGDEAMQELQRGALDLKGWIGKAKTARGQELDREAKEGKSDERGILREAGETMVGALPSLGAAALTGPMMPLTFGALSVGASGLAAEEKLRNMSEEDLYKTPVYSKFRSQGMDHDTAQRATYHEMRKLEAIAPDLVANTIFGGVASRLVGKAFSKTVAGSMTQRIMRTAAQDIPEGVIGGGVSGAAGEFGRQTGDISGGLREGYDTGEIMKAGWDMARPTGVISSAVALGRGVRRPGPARPPSVTSGIIGDANKRANEIGTDLVKVAEDNLSETSRPGPAPVETPPLGGPREPPEGGGGGAPPIRNEIYDKINARRAQEGKPPLKPEEIDAGVAALPPVPKAPLPKPPIDVTAPPEPKKVPGEAAPLSAADHDTLMQRYEQIEARLAEMNDATQEMKNSLEWQEQHALLENEYQELGKQFDAGTRPAPTETAPPAAPITGGAPAEVTPPGKPGFSVEDLKARAADLSQTPTHGDLMKHIAEWKTANPGVKLTEHEAVTKAWTEARDAAKAEQVAQTTQKREADKLAKQQRQDQEKADRLADREAKKQARDALEAEKKAARQTKADQIKADRDARRKARDEAKAKPAEAKTEDAPKRAPPEKTTPKEPGHDLGVTKHADANVEALRQAWVEHTIGGDHSNQIWQAENNRLYDAFANAAEAHAPAVVTPPSKPAPPPKAAKPPKAPKEPKAPKAPKAAPPPEVAPSGRVVLKTAASIAKAAEDKARDTAAARKEDVRGRQKTRREQTAKSVVEQSAPKENEKPVWDAREAAIREGKAEDVVGHIKDVVATAGRMVREYVAELKILRGGNVNHEIYNLGKLLKAGEEGTPEERGKARGQHGMHHAFLANLYNAHREIQDAIKRAEDPKASKEARAEAQAEIKDFAVNFMDNMNLVREGKISEYSAKVAERNAAIETRAKTNKPSDAQVALMQGKDDATKLDIGKVGEIAEQDKRTAKKMTIEEMKQKGIVPSDAILAKLKAEEAAAAKNKPAPAGAPTIDRRGRFRKNAIPTITKEADNFEDWTHGKPDPVNPVKQGTIAESLRKFKQNTGRHMQLDEFADMVEAVYGDKVVRSTFGDLMSDKMRPPDAIGRLIFDVVRNMTKEIQTYAWPSEAHEAYGDHIGLGNSRAFYWSAYGAGAFRHDTLVPRTIFHEALHAAANRALDTSPRLQNLVRKLQEIVHNRFTGTKLTGTWEYKLAIHDGKVFSDPREFISELYTQPRINMLLSSVKLTPLEAAGLIKDGYRADIGKSLLRSLWDGLLKTLGFQSDRPNAFKVAVDTLEDIFQRERMLEERTTNALHPPGSAMWSNKEYTNLRNQDPIGKFAVKAIQQGKYDTAANHLMNMAHKMDGPTLEKTEKYLTAVNEHLYERPAWENSISAERSLPSSKEVHDSVADFLDRRMGGRGKDTAWQIQNKFSTARRHFFQGIRYTNDLGNNLEEGFRRAIQPLKDAWSRREHYAQEYMDKSGANKLIDDLARLKNAIKDRGLWDDFERLLIRESYTRAYADEELGSGRNVHISTGDLRDRQSVRDHAENRKLWEKIAAASPELKDMRNRIHEFNAKELASRHEHLTRDMLLKWNVVGHGDEVGLSAVAKHVRRQEKTMTHSERMAFDRVLKVGKESDVYKNLILEGERIKRTLGEKSPEYQKYEKDLPKRTAEALTHESKEYRAFVEKRGDIRNIIDESVKAGPHVPFNRHGNHVVFAEYHVKPDEGTNYIEANPNAKNDLHKIYDFAERKDAEHFIDETLSHPDVQITVRNAHDVVYDTKSGERARMYTPEEMDAFKEKGEVHDNRFLTAKDLDQMRENGIPVDQYKTYHRVSFNPVEYVRFESEREAHEFREMRNNDRSHPNVTTKVTNVETPKNLVSRANVAYTTAELKQWINRIEASEDYQSMTKEQQAAWKREMRVEAARVTMTAGRRTMMMPREYAKGASTNILKNMIEFSGNNARANAELKYRDAIDKGREEAHAYTDKYRHQSGFNARRLEGETEAAYKARRDEGSIASGHRARQDVLAEIDRRLFAPPRVEDSWATGIKRALQVSMISHLADASYLIVNAMEPWIFSAAITASRHGFIGTYKELAEANMLVTPLAMAKLAGGDIGAAIMGEHRKSNYEKFLVEAVTSPSNTRGDGVRLGGMLNHLFGRGLVARDVGMEVERIHDPHPNALFRGMDWLDNGFRAMNTGVETHNRATMAISNYRLEYAKALKEGKSETVAHDQAVRYAEKIIFDGAGDYGAWNNPRYLNNPFMKLGAQFKKYPLRIASVYADALIGAVRGDKEKMRQVGYMLLTQAIAAGSMGLPLGPFAGTVNAAYLLGFSDNNMDDYEFGMRKWLVNNIGETGADVFLHGVLDLSGANFSSKLDQSSMVFFGSPDSRDPNALMGALGKVVTGAPGASAMAFGKGIQKINEAAEHFSAGADSKGWSAGMEGIGGIVQIKALHNIIRAVSNASTGPVGMPKGNENGVGNTISTIVGFQPTDLARKYEEKHTYKREMKKESTARNTWTQRWMEAPNSAEQRAVFEQIQKNYNAGIPDRRLHITMGDLYKAQNRAKKDAARDPHHIGAKLSGRQKAFGDIHQYYSTE